MIKPTKKSQIQRAWHLIDATDEILGRLSTKIIPLLTGKNKPYFTPHLDCGDHVVVLNAEKVKVSGRKEDRKTYQRYSGYPGGRRTQTLAEIRLQFPTRILEHAVAGMLPDNKLKKAWLSRLHLYVGEKHIYADKLKLSNSTNSSNLSNSSNKSKSPIKSK